MGQMLIHFGRRSYGLIMLALALPNTIPIYIPGLSLICGLPIFLLGYQILRRQPHPTLPAFVQEKSILRGDLVRVIERTLPSLKRVESFLRPRWLELVSPVKGSFVGAAAMILSAFMLIPLPMTNIGPAFGIAFLALGMTESDGVFIAIGVVVGVIACIVTTLLLGIYLAGLAASINFLF